MRKPELYPLGWRYIDADNWRPRGIDLSGSDSDMRDWRIHCDRIEQERREGKLDGIRRAV